MFMLTNKQRAYFGLAPVEDGWEEQLLQADKYRPPSTLVYDRNTLKRQIISTDEAYKEFQLFEKTSNRETLLPKTSKGKPIRLTASSIEKRTPIGTYLIINGKSGVRIGNFTTQRTFYDSYWEGSASKGKKSIAEWVDLFLKGCPKQHLKEIGEFSSAKRQHFKFKSGDYFRFKLGYEEFAFGRVLLDIGRIRKANLIPDDHGFRALMGKPVLIKLYAHVSRTGSFDLEAVERAPALPSDYIFDNALYFGDYEIVGHKEVEEHEYDFPISYRRSPRGNSKVYLHWGLIHIELPESRFDKFLEAENPFTPKIGQTILSDNPYSLLSLGYHPRRTAASIRKTFKNGYFEYEDSWHDYFDLRNPKNEKVKKEIFQAFGLSERDDYVTAAQKRKLPAIRELNAKIASTD